MAHVMLLQTIEAEGIECGWKRVDGYLFPASSDQKDFEALDQEMSAYVRAGLSDIRKVPLTVTFCSSELEHATQTSACILLELGMPVLSVSAQ